MSKNMKNMMKIRDSIGKMGKLELKHKIIDGVSYGDHRPQVNRNPLMRIDPFSIISNADNVVPIVGHVPHGSTFIPHDVRAPLLLSYEDLRKELILMTDRYTMERFSAITDLGGQIFVNNYSRLVVDPERFENDDEEIMSQKGMGVIYTKTASQQMLRKEPSLIEREEILSTYFRPYHAALRKEVQEMLERFGRCLIIDCHSFPSKPLPYEFDQSSDRPDICIGTDQFHTPKELITQIRSFCKTNGINMVIDKPFAGTYVPLMHLHKDRRVSSIMIEVNRGLYMNEATGDRLFRFIQTKEMLDGLLKKIIDRFQSGLE